MANPWSQWLHPSLHIHFAARTEAVHGLQRYQYFLQAAHQESFCGPPHPQVLRGSHAKATWDSEQTIGAQLFRGVFFCRSCQVYELVGMTWEESSPSGRSAGLLVSCSCSTWVARLQTNESALKRPSLRTPCGLARATCIQASPIIPSNANKIQQESRNITKSMWLCRLCACLGVEQKDRRKPGHFTWSILIHIQYIYIHVGAPLTSPRNNMHKDISLASLVLSDSVLPNPSQSLGICHDLPPVLSKHILRSTNLSGNCVYWTPTLLCPILSQPNHCCRTEVMTKKRRLGLSTPESHKQMEQDGTGKFAVPHICNSHLPCGAPNPHIHKPSVPFLPDSCAQSNC